MKKLIFTLSFLSLNLISNAASYRTYISHSVSGSTYTVYVNSDTAPGETVQGQICNNGGSPFSGFVIGTMSSAVPGANWKLVITSSAATPRLELSNINEFNSAYAYTGCNIVMSSVLANELTTFTAAKQNNKVSLNWLTASEKGNDNFSIERSKDGKNFSAIGQLKGALNSTVSKEYAFTDVSPFKGINYYRLKSTEVAGKITYSSVVSVSVMDKVGKTFVYPNPVAEASLRLEHEAVTDGDLQIRVMDISGRVLQTEKRTVINGNNVISLDINHLSSGQYLIAVDEQLVRFVKN
jgi:Secretion system C-terminal sorting domain